MARLHPQLKAALPLLPETVPVHLFTRHSVRELAKDGFADYRLPLTPEGVTMARQWGGELGRPIDRLFSSPVGRCVDTAAAMMEGGMAAGLVKAPLTVEQSMTLVEPGCYVEDVQLVGPHFLKLGALGFINQHLCDGLEGLLTPEQGRRKLLNYLRDRQPDAGSLSVHVTHDTIIIAFLAGLFGQQRVSEQDWPWMMEGVWLWFDDHELHWVWRGEWHRRNLDQLI
ncbi:MAG: histidine phosphatase family protein [Gammaproteobacteria bacterium HGW-Gammaproteobacteria-14]|nr:MAG: histidine phosphatase family protein [Gammaproteobacteria bacterium HGW-Gammaproteobacteria-14]